MKISIDSKYIATVDTSLLGYIGETNARTITVEQPEVPGADTSVSYTHLTLPTT